jgi:RHS repeat-associated protein
VIGAKRRRVGGSLASIAIVTALALIATGLRTSPAEAAPGATNPITYVYDEVGRLTAAIDPTLTAAQQGLVRYTYDDVGNLLSISRSSAESISIVTFHGEKGQGGEPVTIWGTLFNTTASQNEVRFGGSGGAIATVSSATETTLKVTVPAGAPTGPIYVKNLGTGTSATSSKVFTVTGSPAPTISSVSAPTAHPGDPLTITGTNLSADPEKNVVTIGAVRARVTAATATQLTITVPPRAWSGPVAVRTPDGAVTGPDLFMPTATIYADPEPADYIFRGRIASGGSQSLSLTSRTNDDTSVLLVPATRGQTIGLTLTNMVGMSNNQMWQVAIVDPLDRVRASSLAWMAGFSVSGTASVDGDYAIVVSKVTGEAATSATLNAFVSDLLTTANPVTPPATPSFTMNQPGQLVDFMFHATEGQTIRITATHPFLQATRHVFTPSQPQGDPSGSPRVNFGFVLNGGCSSFVAAETGQHRFLLTPWHATDSGAVAVTVATGTCGSSPAGAAAPTGAGGGQDQLDRERDQQLEALAALARDYSSPDVEDWRPDPDTPQTWVTGYGPSSFDGAVLPHAPDGQTALSGRLLKLNGEPLEGATVEMVGVTATTDVTGAFLLTGIPHGKGELIVDGRAAGSGGARYGRFEFSVHPKPNRTTELEFSVWMPRVDGFASVPVTSPTPEALVVTDPSMPGLEIHIPEGVSITDEGGSLVPEIGLVPIPLDRPPFPLPTLAHFPMHFALQPGDAYVAPEGFRVIYPNQLALAGGYRARVWRYITEQGIWRPYGQAQVHPNGRRIEPDPGVVLYDFAGASIQPLFASLFGLGCGDESGNAAAADPTTEPTECSEDPVDLSNGTLRHAETDLVEPGPMPIRLERIYRQNDSNIYYTFAMATAAPWDMFLVNSGNPTAEDTIDLAIPGSHNVRFELVSGTTTLYEAKDARGRFAGAQLEVMVNARHWMLARDGTRYRFFWGRLEEQIDRFGNVALYGRSYSTANYLVTDGLALPSGRWIHLDYPTAQYPATATDSLGRTVAYTYETPVAGVTRLESVTDARQTGEPSPVARAYTWNTDTTVNSNLTGLPSPATYLMQIEDARGNLALVNNFDAQGRVDLQTFANGGQFTFDYDGDATCPAQTKVTDPTGDVTCASYDADGFVTQMRSAVGTPDERTITYVRDATTHRLESVTDAYTDPQTGPKSRTFTYEYDPKGNRTTIARSFTNNAGNPDTQTVTLSFDPGSSQISSITDDLGHQTTFSYHYPEGCLTQITDASNRSVSFTCTTTGQVKKIIDTLSNETVLSYALGDLTKVTDALGRATSRFTDAAGRALAVTDAYGYRTALSYDPLSNLTKVTDARAKSTSFTYDNNSNLTEVSLDAMGSRYTYTYNNVDLVDVRTDPIGQQTPSGHQDFYEYDLGGRLKKWTDRRGNVMRYCFDAADRLTFVGYKLSGADNACASTFESTTAYTWDGWGRLTKVVDSAGGTITRTLDELGRLKTDAGPNGTVTYTYDDANRRATMAISGQPTVSYGYLNNNLLSSITRGSNVVSFAYDNANRPDTITFPNGTISDYSFDAASQVSQILYKKNATTTNGTLKYGHDADGRRSDVYDTYARLGLPAATTSNAQYNANNELTSWNGTTAAYDNNGNLTSYGAQSYTFNARNQLTATSGGAATFAYDGLGRRSQKVVSGTTTKFLYDGLNVVQEKNAAGTVTANQIVGLGVDQTLWRNSGGQSRSFYSDGLGSMLALTGGSGGIQTSYTYEPYGKPTPTGADATNNRFQFTAREWDGATGLQFNRARYYNPTWGRFISEDPIGLAGGANVYSYVGSSPPFLTDPMGLFLKDLWHDFIQGLHIAWNEVIKPLGVLVWEHKNIIAAVVCIAASAGACTAAIGIVTVANEVDLLAAGAPSQDHAANILFGLVSLIPGAAIGESAVAARATQATRFPVPPLSTWQSVMIKGTVNLPGAACAVDAEVLGGSCPRP